MGCTSCGSVSCGTGSDGKVQGCNSNGGCAGGCNRLNSFDWLSDLWVPTIEDAVMVEVSFNNGARKGFYSNPHFTHTTTGDMVVVEADTGYDVGAITLSGELVRLQMKKKGVREESFMASVVRRANVRDIERLAEAREAERETMIRARAMARALKLDMKIGDVEFQGDKRKATFYYTADGRVDFRELIKLFAKEFKVKIEMRQIGARQESARIGGIGSCGRELCCSTWLSDFKSVSTAAARYQNLAINQAKLSGQCGRLKCCLNFELDVYIDALEAFPEKADRLETQSGTAYLLKTDVFKQLMYYSYRKEGISKIYMLDVKYVQSVVDMNRKGIKPTELVQVVPVAPSPANNNPKNRPTKDAPSTREDEEDEEVEMEFADGTGEIELADDPKRKRKKRKKPKKIIDETTLAPSTPVDAKDLDASEKLITEAAKPIDALEKSTTEDTKKVSIVEKSITDEFKRTDAPKKPITDDSKRGNVQNRPTQGDTKRGDTSEKSPIDETRRSNNPVKPIQGDVKRNHPPKRPTQQDAQRTDVPPAPKPPIERKPKPPQKNLDTDAPANKELQPFDKPRPPRKKPFRGDISKKPKEPNEEGENKDV